MTLKSTAHAVARREARCGKTRMNDLT